VQFCRISRSLDVSHLFIRTDLVLRYLRDNFSSQEVRAFLDGFRSCWRPVYQSGIYAVWKLAEHTQTRPAENRSERPKEE
jgi:hypothetical protein